MKKIYEHSLLILYVYTYTELQHHCTIGGPQPASHLPASEFSFAQAQFQAVTARVDSLARFDMLH